MTQIKHTEAIAIIHSCKCSPYAQAGQRLAPRARLPSPARLAILFRSPLYRWMLAELIAILAGLAAIAAYLLGRRAGRQEDPWVLVGDTPPATTEIQDSVRVLQAARKAQGYDNWGAPVRAPAGEVQTPYLSTTDAPVAARTVHWKAVVEDPVRALRNWTCLARTARRLRRLRIIWSGLGNHLKQFSCLR